VTSKDNFLIFPVPCLRWDPNYCNGYNFESILNTCKTWHSSLSTKPARQPASQPANQPPNPYEWHYCCVCARPMPLRARIKHGKCHDGAKRVSAVRRRHKRASSFLFHDINQIFHLRFTLLPQSCGSNCTRPGCKKMTFIVHPYSSNSRSRSSSRSRRAAAAAT
jgi:hypothetical protein